MDTPIVYHSLGEILKVLETYEKQDDMGVKKLLRVYENAKNEQNKHDLLGEQKRFPLIVLEGLDGSGKTTVGNRFAKKIGATKWKTPPESLSDIRSLFDDNVTGRSTAFYSLGNYIAALEVKTILGSGPVVMDRYWHSTAAYALAEAVQDSASEYSMPTEGDKIYRWPDDLFKPDIVVFLNVSEEVRKERLSRRKNITVQEDRLSSDTEFRANIIQAYRNMYDPRVTFINGDLPFEPVLAQLSAESENLFK